MLWGLKHILIFCLTFLSGSEMRLRCFWCTQRTYFPSSPKHLLDALISREFLLWLKGWSGRGGDRGVEVMGHLLSQPLDTGLWDLGLCILTSRSSWQETAALRLREGQGLHFCLQPSTTPTLSVVAWERGKVESWHCVWHFLTDMISSGTSDVLWSRGYLWIQMHRHPLGGSQK